MSGSITQLTIDDFERLPLEQVENHDLVDGELVPAPDTTFQNNLIRGYLICLLAEFIEGRSLGVVVGEQDYDFGGNVYGPDVTFFGPAKLALVDPLKRVQRFVPDLAIEVASPNDTFASLLRKKDRYRRCGTAEVWIVAPESREVYVYTSAGDRILREDGELTTALLPGFQLSLARLFA